MFGLREYAILALAISLITLYTAKEIELSGMEKKNKVLTNEVEILKALEVKGGLELTLCKSSVQDTNNKIELLSVDRDKAIRKYNELKQQPPKIIRDVIKEPSNECEDIKSTIDHISHLDTNLLQ